MTRLAGVDGAIAALCDTVRLSEIGRAMLALSDSGYNVLVGSTPSRMLLFHDYAHHPRVLNRDLDSTAAGAYQIIWPTWHSLVLQHGYTDFGPENQDRGCIQLLRDAGAVERVLAGDVEGAITMAAPIWASLPGSTAGQHTNTMTDLLNAYAVARARYDNGGVT
jgi:muramidase (phage lysozyme)